MPNRFLPDIQYAAILHIGGPPGRFALLTEHDDPPTPEELQEVLTYLSGFFSVPFKVYGNIIASKLEDDWEDTGFTGTPPGPLVFTNPSFNGSGLPVVVNVAESSGFLGNDIVLGTMSPGASDVAVSITLDSPRTNVKVTINNFGTTAGEQLRNISPAFTSISGDGLAIPGNTGVDPTVADGSVILTWEFPAVSVINFKWQDAGSGASSLGKIEFT